MTCALAATAIASASSAQAAELKVAYMPCGNVNDKSWSENGYLGLQDAQKTLAASGTTMKLDYTESQPASKVEAAARDYASRGYDIIVLHCGTFADAALNIARAFPKTTVLYVTAPPETNWPPNFWYYDIAQQEGQFAAGVLAGLTTKVGRVAAIASFDFPGHVAPGRRVHSRRSLRQRESQIQPNLYRNLGRCREGEGGRACRNRRGADVLSGRHRPGRTRRVLGG